MADQPVARPLHVLRQYVRGMVEATTGPDQLPLRRLHDQLRSATDLVHADYGDIHRSVQQQGWKLHRDLSPGQIAALDRAIARIGVLEGSTLQAPLTPRDLAGHLRATARSESDPDRKLSMQRLAGFLTRPGSGQSTAPEVLQRLGAEQWKLENGLDITQKGVLDDVVRQTRQLAGSPARVRGYADGAQLESRDAVAEAAPSSERWLARQNDLDRLVAAAEGSVVVHTDTAGSVAVRYGAEHAPGHTGFKTFGDGAARGSRPELGYYLTHEPGMHGGFHDPQGQPVQPIEGVTFEPVTKMEYDTPRKVTEGWLRRTTREVPVPLGERPVMVDGPNGPEEAVRFGYGYNHRLAGHRRDLDLPSYTESSGHRDGNMLVVHAVLPKSTAEALGRTIARDPQFARDLVEKLVVERGGLPKDIWEHGKPPDMNRSKPPYEQLPADHRIHRFDPGPDGTAVATPMEWAAPHSAPQQGAGVERFAQTGGIDGPNAGTADARPNSTHGQASQQTQDPRYR